MDELQAVFGEHTKEFLHFCDAAASTADLDNKLTVKEFVHTILSDAEELPGTHHMLSSAFSACAVQQLVSFVRLHIPLNRSPMRE